MKNIRIFYLKIIIFFGGKILVYLNRHDFAMYPQCPTKTLIIREKIAEPYFFRLFMVELFPFSDLGTLAGCIS